MAIVWLVTVGDQERNFPRKRDAIAWLSCLTHDTRPTPAVHREHGSRYWYYGPGEDLQFVTRAVIDRLGFPPRRFYAPKPRSRRNRPDELASAGCGSRNTHRARHRNVRMRDLTRNLHAATRLHLYDRELWLDTDIGERDGLCIGIGDRPLELLDDARRELRARLGDLEHAYRAMLEPERTQ